MHVRRYFVAQVMQLELRIVGIEARLEAIERSVSELTLAVARLQSAIAASSSTPSAAPAVEGTPQRNRPFYTVVRVPRGRNAQLGVWKCSWSKLCEELRISSIAGSGFHFKKFADRDAAVAYWHQDFESEPNFFDLLD